MRLDLGLDLSRRESLLGVETLQDDAFKVGRKATRAWIGASPTPTPQTPAFNLVISGAEELIITLEEI